MKWHKEKLDVILVPGGLLIMFGYHIFLLYKYLKNSKSTVIGFDNYCQKLWVNKLMQIDAMSRGPAFMVMNSTIIAANSMASTSLTLSSLIGAWVGSSSGNELVSKIIYGDTRLSIGSIKYISILLFFLLAFACFVQSSRSYVHANLLLSMPIAEVPEDYVVEALVQGANYWQAGLRAIYFAITMLMWIFGPIPMFISSVVMVSSLYVLDVNRKKYIHEFKELNSKEKDQKKDSVVGSGIEHQAMQDGNHVLQANTTVLSTAVAH